MPSVNLYNAFAGCTSLLEYQGSAGDIVALTGGVQYAAPALFNNVALSSIAALTLLQLRDQGLAARYTGTLLLQHAIRQANSNGVIHVVIPQTSALSAGDIVHLSALVVGV